MDTVEINLCILSKTTRVRITHLFPTKAQIIGEDFNEYLSKKNINCLNNEL